MKEHEILRMIMQNKLICPVSEPEAYKWLKDSEDNFNRISNHLEPFGIKLVSMCDGDVYAGLNAVPSESDKKAISKQFHDIYNNIGPIIEMLTCLASADENNNALVMGDKLKQAELVLAANDNKHFESMLNQVSEITGATKKPNDQQVEALLERLRKHDIVILSNSAQKIYRVTGMISYISQIFEYITENLFDDFDEEAIELQQGLGL
jgi:superfamily II DNA or RNA helicase